jgi:hypothetical protein
MKLSEIRPTLDEHEAGTWMDVCDEFGEKSDIKFLVVGPDSETWQKIEMMINRDSLEAAASGEPSKRARHDYLAMAVKDWENVDGDDGNPKEFDRDEVREFYRTRPYEAARVDKWLAKRKNFMPPNSKD